MEYNCPNCGAPIQFRSKVSIYTTCTFCRSNIVRHDTDLEKIGESSELLRDLSPLQVGTRGTWDNIGFLLLGRVKVAYPSGMWSEWYALMDDGREGWLAVAQGLYMMSFRIPNNANVQPGELSVGSSVTFKDDVYVVEDNREIKYIASEGELPFVYEPGFTAVSVDLRGRSGKFLNFLFGREGVETFIGRYARYEDFNFKDLRSIDGWDS